MTAVLEIEEMNEPLDVIDQLDQQNAQAEADNEQLIVALEQRQQVKPEHLASELKALGKKTTDLKARLKELEERRLRLLSAQPIAPVAGRTHELSHQILTRSVLGLPETRPQVPLERTDLTQALGPLLGRARATQRGDRSVRPARKGRGVAGRQPEEVDDHRERVAPERPGAEHVDLHEASHSAHLAADRRRRGPGVQLGEDVLDEPTDRVLAADRATGEHVVRSE